MGRLKELLNLINDNMRRDIGFFDNHGAVFLKFNSVINLIAPTGGRGKRDNNRGLTERRYLK